MFGSNFIEIGIALSFLFLLLSLLSSLLSETFSKYLSWRAEMLEESIQQILHDPEMAALFYRHSMIRALGRKDRPIDKQRKLDALARKNRLAAWVNRKLDYLAKPSYIRSTIFARVVLDIVVAMPRRPAVKALRDALGEVDDFDDTDAQEKLIAALDTAELDPPEAFGAKMDDLGRLTALHIKNERERKRIQKLIEDAKAAATPAKEADAQDAQDARAPLSLDEIRAAAGKLEDSESRRLLTTLLTGSDVRTLAQAQSAIARWYDDVQERVTEWYKRKSQRWVFFISLALTLALNIDTMLIADRLLRDNSLRAAIVAAADTRLEKYRSAAAPPSAPRAPTIPPTPAGTAGPVAAPGGSTDKAPAPSEAAATTADPVEVTDSAPPHTFTELKEELDALALPIGWPGDRVSVAPPCNHSLLSLAQQLYRRHAEMLGSQEAAAKEQAATATGKLAKATERVNAAKAELSKVIESSKKAKPEKKEDGSESKAAGEALSRAQGELDGAQKELGEAEAAAAGAAQAVMQAGELVGEAKGIADAAAKEAARAGAAAAKVNAAAAKVKEETDADLRAWPPGARGEIKRVIGWLFTAFAAALGAQFWFDVLSKIMHIRTSGKKPSEEKEAGATAPL